MVTIRRDHRENKSKVSQTSAFPFHYCDVVVVVLVVVVLTLTRIIKPVVTGQAPVTLELRNIP